MKTVWAALALLAASFSPANTTQQPMPALRVIVPAYFYPSGKGRKEWDRLLRTPGLSNVIIIVNPASGPGTIADPAYVALIERARSTPATLIGYVTTSYAKRSAAEVKADVDGWLRLYPAIRGIFFDEQASGPAHLDYYRALYSYVRKEKALDLVVSNPGTVCDEGYYFRNSADVICLFEGTWKSGVLDMPAWAAKYDPARTYALPYKVPTARAMREIVRSARQKGIGAIYVTDASGVNPWNRLPRYWEEEAAAVLAENAR